MVAIARFGLAVLLMLSGCGVLSDSPSRMELVWLTGGQVYVLRGQESGRQVWHRDGDQETLLARGRDIPGTCGGVNWIFDARERLGIVLDCGDFQRLVAYTPESGTYQTLFDVPAVGEVAIRPDGQGGYLAKAVGGCWSLGTFGSMPADALTPLSRFTCEQGGSAKAPHLLPNGDLLFAGRAPDQWQLYVLTIDGAVREVGPVLDGFPELDVTGDSATAIVALTVEDEGTLVAVDLATGGLRRLVDADASVHSPAISPDGHEILYLQDLGDVVLHVDRVSGRARGS